MKKLTMPITLIAIIVCSLLLSGCVSKATDGNYNGNPDRQNQEETLQRDLPASTETEENTSAQTETSQLSLSALPGYDKYPWSFSIFIACVNRELPLEWKELKSLLADAGYEFWYPNDDETGGWMLYPNRNDEQGYYSYELTTLFGGVSEDNEIVQSLMYQLNVDFDYVMVEFRGSGDRYTIREGYDEWEVDTFDELISFAVAALDKEYERANG